MTARPFVLTVELTGDVAGVAALNARCVAAGLRVTWLIAPEVLLDRAAVAELRGLDDCERGLLRTGTAPGNRELEQQQLATCTELFRQQLGHAPHVFRARDGQITAHTGGLLQQLGFHADSSLLCALAPAPWWLVSTCGELRESGSSALLELPCATAPGATLPWCLDVPFDALPAMLEPLATAVRAASDVQSMTLSEAQAWALATGTTRSRRCRDLRRELTARLPDGARVLDTTGAEPAFASEQDHRLVVDAFDATATTTGWIDDALDPLAIPDLTFDAVAALASARLARALDIERWLDLHVPRLNRGGLVALAVPTERAPDLALAARRRGLTALAEQTHDDWHRALFAMPVLPRVLFVVDEAGWAHDHKTAALQARLGDRFAVRKVFQAGITADDVAWADLVIVYYWLQIAGCEPLARALDGNLHKLVLGVCSHAELETERRDEALALLREVGAVFVHSELLRAEVAPLLHPGQLLFCLPNGVDTRRFTPATTPRRPGPLRVGWAGSIDNFGRELRGFDEIERTCRGLPGIEFTPAIKERGRRDHGAMADYYHSIDVHVCMSRCEGTPNPALEAAASGVPLVTTRVGNMPEFVRDGHNGLFVQRGDGSLAAALCRLRDDEALRARMADAARRTAEQWSWPVQAEGYARMLTGLLTGDAIIGAVPVQTR